MKTDKPHKQTMGRPRDFNEDEVLDRIMHLFWAHGFHGVSVDTLSQAAGIGKQSLYKAFGNKRSMYLRALERYETLEIDTAADALRSAAPPQDRLHEFLSAPIDGARTGMGCFLCNASADQAAHDDAIRDRVRQGFRTMADALADTVSERTGRSGGPTPADCDRAWSLLSVYSGLQVMSRSGVDRTRLEAMRDTALRS